MINELRLTNFRQHTKRTFNFSEGLNVLKGANEAGKSTILQAILYLWFGSKALSESLSEVVTYGESEKTLRVEGDFTIDGVQYTAYRAPSGAEIAYGDHRVTGQTEVTRFMERLLGAKADVVRKLMIAEQNSVRGILESDSKAGALIENLAELGIIETLIEKVQNQLPTGPTKGVESTIKTLQESVGEVPVRPTDEAVRQAKAAHEAADAAAKAKAPEVECARLEAEDAKAFLAESSNNDAVIASLQKRKRELESVLGPGLCKWTAEDLAAAEKLEQDVKFRAEVEKAKAFVPLTHESSWSGSEESAEEEGRRLVKKVRDLTSKASAESVTMASKLAMKINEGVCSFCKLDISQRPEVLETNTALDSEIAALKLSISKLKAEAAEAEADEGLIRSILEIHRSNTRKVNTQFWKPSADTLPATYEWIGPELGDNLSVSVSSSQIKAEMRNHEVTLNRYTAAQEELRSLNVPLPFHKEEIESCHHIIEEFGYLQSKMTELINAVSAAKTQVTLAEGEFLSQLRVYEAAVESRNKSLQTVEDAKKTLTDMEFNNQLIKDMRDARSEIRRRLWVTVTSAISVYFSRIRKVETLITQSDDGFLQNGKSVGGLSGSAKDMLGLAVRAALMKTFIPGAPIMVVDEPFSGCDDDREIAGIGVLASLGFPQTLLVTHSDLADSMASSLVQL